MDKHRIFRKLLTVMLVVLFVSQSIEASEPDSYIGLWIDDGGSYYSIHKIESGYVFIDLGMVAYFSELDGSYFGQEDSEGSLILTHIGDPNRTEPYMGLTVGLVMNIQEPGEATVSLDPNAQLIDGPVRHLVRIQ
ncbi:hypothetical protein [Endothiovibrio diazotrophicus]